MTRRIYIADLSAYNAGIPHGTWIEADSDPDTMQEEIATLLLSSPEPNTTTDCPVCEGTDDDCNTCGGTGTVPTAEEFAIHDHEGYPDGLIAEYTSIQTIADIEAGIDQCPDEDTEAAWLQWLAHDTNYNKPEDFDRFEECYQGCHKSLADYAQQFHEDCGSEIPDWITNYIDWQDVGRDMKLNGDIYTIELGYRRVLVFENH